MSERSDTVEARLNTKVFSLFALHKATQFLTSTFDLKLLSQLAVDAVLEMGHSKNGALYLEGESGADFQLAAAKSLEGVAFPAAFGCNAPLVRAAEDRMRQPFLWTLSVSGGEALVLPFAPQDVLTGFFVLHGRVNPAPWNADDLEILEMFASHVGLCLQAQARVQQQLTRLALLHQITRAIGERQDLRSILLVVLRRLEQDLPVAFACLCLGAPGSDTMTVMAVGPASQALAPTVGLAEQEVGSLDQMGLRTCVEGQSMSVLDTAQESIPLLQRFAQAGLRSLIATPLLVEDSLFGLLLVARRNAQSFSSGEGEFLRQLSEHVALATQQASLYAKLQQAYDDLHQSQQVVMQQERLHAMGQMASGIAHDINNAISPITLYVESLLANEPTLSARAREHLSIVQQAAQDVAHTVARLREFYRQPSESQERLPVDLDEIVPQVVELTRAKWRDEPQHRGSTIEVHMELQGVERARVLGVQSELREAFINLVFNAVDAMPQGGTLTLQTRTTPTVVVVEVIDTGIGMDEVTRQRCLEPFYTTKGERGTGLGLAMVYGILERHEAQLSIESAVGHGTTMRLLFPRAPSDSAADARQVEVEASPPPLRILVVDDDPILRQSLQHVLQTEGHTVTLADGGEAGLAAFHTAQAQQAPFAVVMTDLGMPGMDGREVARAVKHTAPTTPVILLTGWGQALQREKHLPPHVDCLLSKPPRLRELRAALVALTGAGAGGRTRPRTDVLTPQVSQERDA